MRENKAQESINQRINFLIEYYEAGNKSAFGRRVDMKSGVVGDLVGGRMNKPSYEAILKILSAYPSVNTDWLLKGEGEMLKPIARSGANVQDLGVSHELSTDTRIPPGAGELSISSDLLRGDRSPHISQDESGFSYGTQRKSKRRPGMDVVEQLQQHSADIEKLQAAVRMLQNQLKS